MLHNLFSLSIGKSMKAKNILENLEHVNLVDRWIHVCNYANNEADRMYLAERIKKYFPEYRESDLLELSDKLESIFALA
jgi:hypothetical protein